MHPHEEQSLKEFAEDYLGEGGILKIRVSGEGALRVGPKSTELVLYRDPPFQVTLVTFFPGYRIPSHAHRYVDAYALSITGDGVAIVGGRTWRKQTQDHPRLSLRIPVLSGVMHSGHTEVGSVFLSIQKWKEGRAPTFLSEDWVDDEA